MEDIKATRSNKEAIKELLKWIAIMALWPLTMMLVIGFGSDLRTSVQHNTDAVNEVEKAVAVQATEIKNLSREIREMKTALEGLRQ